MPIIEGCFFQWRNIEHGKEYHGQHSSHRDGYRFTDPPDDHPRQNTGDIKFRSRGRIYPSKDQKGDKSERTDPKRNGFQQFSLGCQISTLHLRSLL